jgi:hypothetical protein
MEESEALPGSLHTEACREEKATQKLEEKKKQDCCCYVTKKVRDRK